MSLEDFCSTLAIKTQLPSWCPGFFGNGDITPECFQKMEGPKMPKIMQVLDRLSKVNHDKNPLGNTHIW